MQYQESVAITQKERKKIFIRILAALAFTYLASSAYAALGLPYRGIANILFLGVMAAAIYFAFRHGIIEYIYQIEEDALVFLTRLGGYERVLVRTPFSCVRCIAGLQSETVSAAEEKFRYNAVKTSGSEQKYACIFTDAAGNLCKLVFEPSARYLEKAEQAGICVNL